MQIVGELLDRAHRHGDRRRPLRHRGNPLGQHFRRRRVSAGLTRCGRNDRRARLDSAAAKAREAEKRARITRRSAVAAGAATHRSAERARQQFAGQHHAGTQHHGGERGDQHGRQLLRIGRHVRYRGAGDHPRIGRRRGDGVAGARLAVFGQIRFEEVALRFGVALERAQLHVVFVGGRRLALELVEAGKLRGDPGVGELGVVFERPCKELRLFPDLLVEVVDLRLQFLDARMVVEQRGGLLGELGA